MTLDEVFRHFASQVPPRFAFEAMQSYCLKHRATPEEFIEQFSRFVVEGYLNKRLSWVDCDIAMNGLCVEIPNFDGLSAEPWETYLAFDAGEHHPDQPGLTEDEVTRPLLEEMASRLARNA